MTHTTVMADPPRCDNCGQLMRPILHGMPSVEGFVAARRGEVLLGGCTIPPVHDSPWGCTCDPDDPTGIRSYRPSADLGDVA